MSAPLKQAVALAALVAAVPIGAAAHGMVVFASVDCEAVLVEAKFSNGRAVRKGEVQISDGAGDLLTTVEIGADGTAAVPLDSLDYSEGLLIVVDTGDHDDYWILTPEDIARKCGS